MTHKSHKVTLLQISLTLLTVTFVAAPGFIIPLVSCGKNPGASPMRVEVADNHPCALQGCLEPQLCLAPCQDRAGRVVPDGSHQDSDNTRNPPGEIPNE